MGGSLGKAANAVSPGSLVSGGLNAAGISSITSALTGVEGYGPGSYNQASALAGQAADRSRGLESSFLNRAQQDYKYSYDALKQLQSAASGKAPSAAQGVLQKGLDQGIAAQMAMANSASPSQSMGAQKKSMENAALMTQDTANQASILRANEMATARQQYAGATQQLYGQNIGMAGSYGQMSAGLIGNMISGGASMYGAGQQAQATASAGMFGGAGAAIAGIATSDEETKRDIRPPTEGDIDDFLEAVKPMLFKYKKADGAHGKTPGEHLGVIAQELEKTHVGKSLVVDTPEGKAIDLPSTVGTILAASARMHDRITSLESYFESRKNSKGRK